MSRSHICDVPGCTRSRCSWQRLCDSCFSMLPGDIRTGIKETFRTNKKAYSAFRRRARAHLDGVNAGQPGVAPETVYERTARMLGERDEAA